LSSSGGSTERLGELSPKIMKREGFSLQNSKGGSYFFPGVVTLTEVTDSAVATYEANEATASVKFVASVKI